MKHPAAKKLSLKFSLFAALLFVATILTWLASPRLVRAAEGDPQWARTPVSPPSYSAYDDVATDSSGNSYVVGSMYSNSAYNFGNGVTVIGGYALSYNAVLVKYNSGGTAQWARSMVVAPNRSEFFGVATDASGNVYVAGEIYGNGQFDLGNGVTVTGGYSTNFNTVIVKYDSSGNAQWAKSTVVAPERSQFWAVATDTSGNIYASGNIYTNGQFNFGNSVTVTGGNVATYNPIIVKYDSSGNAQWAKSTVVGPADSIFYGVSADTSGNSYVAGYIFGNSQFNFGNSVTVTGGYTLANTLIVKYDSNGNAQWAKSTVVGSNQSLFNGLSVDAGGNSYAAGTINNNGQYDFGNGVTATGVYAAGSNSVIVKYNSSGVTQWAKTAVTASANSSFYGISSDSSGNSYAVGGLSSGVYNFGNSVTITDSGHGDVFIVKYDPNGTPQWGKGLVSAPGYSYAYGSAVDTNGNSYAAATLGGVGEYVFDNGVTATGTTGADAVLIKYAGPPIASTGSVSTSGSAAPSSEIQIPQMSQKVTFNIICSPIKDSDTKGQEVLTIIQPMTFGFDAYLSSVSPLPSSLISTGFTNTILGGGVNGILGVKTFAGTYWQVGRIEELWYKAYPPPGYEAAKIIPELQVKPSIIAFKYKESDLIPLGRPNAKYDPKKFKLAHSHDGKNWVILPASVVDTVNRSVAVIEKVGGYYMIVGQ